MSFDREAWPRMQSHRVKYMRSVACPRCGAAVDEKCKDQRQPGREMYGYHASRKALLGKRVTEPGLASYVKGVELLVEIADLRICSGSEGQPHLTVMPSQIGVGLLTAEEAALLVSLCPKMDLRGENDVACSECGTHTGFWDIFNPRCTNEYHTARDLRRLDQEDEVRGG